MSLTTPFLDIEHNIKGTCFITSLVIPLPSWRKTSGDVLLDSQRLTTLFTEEDIVYACI